MNAAVLAIIQAAIVLVAGATAVWWGGVAVTWVFGRLSPAAETDDVAGPQAETAVLRGGEWIGRVERTAVFATVLTGFPEGIAIALALKGIGRYPELKTGSKVASERFIIGTFVSLLVAAGLGGLSHWALQVI
mgnify:FL=1